MKIYLVHIWSGVEPHVYGPFKSVTERNSKLKYLIGKGDHSHSYFAMNILKNGQVKMYSFSEEFVEKMSRPYLDLICEGHK